MMLAVCATGAVLAVAQPQQAAMTVVPATAAPRQSEALKALQAAMQEKDAAKRVTMLEAFIRDNPNSSALSTAYSFLLSALRTTDRDKADKLIDELLAKYTDPKSPIRRTAYSSKFMSLAAQKKTDEIHSLAQKVLDTETDPSLLVTLAMADKEFSAKLFEKAIAERIKDSNATASPTLEDLRWQYGQNLIRMGRKDEGLKLSLDVLEASKKAIAAAQALPANDPQKRRAEMLRRTLGSRYQSLSRVMAEAGDYPKALDYLDLSVPTDPMGAFESRPSLEMMRADIYQKMGKPDLQMESYTKAYAARMDASTRDKITDLAKKTGSAPEKAFARARKMRKNSATPIKPFELKSIEGKVTTLASVKSKVTLINFFFPT